MLTLSSCFYIMKSKFEPTIYISWMQNFLSIVNEFYLVIYTDKNSFPYIPKKYLQNPKIKVILKELTEFYNYQYKDAWIRNHDKNYLLKDRSCWELNMLWCEKVWFVNDTHENKYFDTEFYGWCDIGYFRSRENDTPLSLLSHWGKMNPILEDCCRKKIVYGCINNSGEVKYIMKLVNLKNPSGLPKIPIPPTQNTISGGFFIIHKEQVAWWANTFDLKLKIYFENHSLVKDDQIILVDCIFSAMDKFHLFVEQHSRLDNWFMFQRIL